MITDTNDVEMMLFLSIFLWLVQTLAFLKRPERFTNHLPINQTLRLLFDDFHYQMQPRQPDKHQLLPLTKQYCFEMLNPQAKASLMADILCFCSDLICVFFSWKTKHWIKIICFCTQKWHKFLNMNRSQQSKHSAVWAEGRSLFSPSWLSLWFRDSCPTRWKFPPAGSIGVGMR